jgi:hypothetical protein
MRPGIAAAIAAIGALVLAQGAAASTQVGNVCEGTEEGTNDVVMQLGNASSALPIEAPGGVVTEWKVTSGVETTQRLKVLVPTGPENKYGVVAETDAKNITPGANAFAARIPVPAGARFGLFARAPSGGLYCEGKTGDVMGYHGGDLIPTDAPEEILPAPNFRAAVSAVVEPDADHDGFGDETQDKCPQSAAFQAPCPQIALDLYPVVEKTSVTLIVVADHEAPVTVSASAVTPKAPKAKKKRASSSGKVAINGGTQTVGPGRLSQFKLKFPSKLKSPLKSLPVKKSVKLTITATATNLVGQTSTRSITVKLKGQAKPK